jgi:hypothetical protein
MISIIDVCERNGAELWQALDPFAQPAIAPRRFNEDPESSTQTKFLIQLSCRKTLASSKISSPTMSGDFGVPVACA